MNIYKRIGIGISLFVLSGTVLYFGALISVPYLVDLNKYKDYFSDELEKQSGFKVSCEDIRFKRSLTPYFKIQIHHYAVLYPDDEIFLKIKDADIKVKIIPLLFKKIVIKDAKFTRPIINISLYKDFTTSLERYIAVDKKNIYMNGFNLDGIIADTVCERYKLKIYDETTDRVFSLEGDELKILDLNPKEKVNLIVKGTLFQDEKKYINYDTALKIHFNKNENKLTISPFEQIFKYDVQGNVSGNLEIFKNNNLKGNLNLNDFSLKFDDNILANNTVNLTFKGEEVEAVSSLHTSEKDEACIKGRFNYGKKKYIDLAVNAKNIDIAKLQKIINVVSHSLNIPNKYSEIKLTGLLNAEFTVNSDLKKLKSSGKAEIINAEIFHKSLPYKVNKINSLVNLNDNKILIEKANAYVNSTQINAAGMIKEDLSVNLKAYSDNLDLTTISNLFLKNKELPLAFMRGKLSFSSDITGKIDKDLTADTLVSIENFNAVENKQKLPVSIKKISLNIKNNKNKYSGEVLCFDFSTMFNSRPLSAETFQISFDDKNIKIPQNTIKIVNSPLSISGGINNYTAGASGNIDFSGNIAAKNIAEVLAEYIKQPYKAAGNINLSGNLNFINKDIQVSAKLKSDKDNYLSYLVIKELLNRPSVLNIDAQFSGKNINIKDISLNEDIVQKTEPRFKISGQILNEKEAVFKNLKIQVPESVTAAMNFFGGEEVSLNGDILVNNTVKNPDIKGNIKVQRYTVKKLYTLVKNADISFNKDNIRIIAPEVDVNTSKFNVLIDIEPKLSDVITISNMQVNSLNLDLNTLFPLIEKERNPFAETLFNIKKGSATINNFQVLDLKAKDISSDFTLKNNTLKAEGINAAAYNGQVSGALSYDLNHSQLNINLVGKGLDIKNSLYDLCKIEDNFAGKADFTSSVSLITGDYNSVIKSLSGRITFNAKEGRMGTLGRFEYYMNAQNLLYHGLLNATLNAIADAVRPDNTARFKTAEGSIFLQNGYLIAEEIRTCGQNMSLYMKGRYNILSNLANIDIYGRISDEIKSKLGSFANVSISELVNGQPSKKHVSVMPVQSSIIDSIHLWNNENNYNTNTFKVNVYGNINYPSSINSFSWVVSDEKKDDNLPEFSEIPQSL